MPRRYRGFHDSCCSSVSYFGYCPFNYEDFGPFKATSGYDKLKSLFGCSRDQLEGPFALHKVRLVSSEFAGQCIDLVRNCPALQHVAVDFSTVDSTALLDTLVEHPSVCGLHFRHTEFEYWGFPSQFQEGRFKQLQRVHFPEMARFKLLHIMHVLAESSLESLEVLGMHPRSTSVKDVAAILATFLNLTEMDLGSVRIYVR